MKYIYTFFCIFALCCAQEGFSQVICTQSGKIFAGDRTGAGIFEIGTGNAVPIGDISHLRARGAYVHDGMLYYKKITLQGQIPCAMHVESGREYELYAPARSCGVGVLCGEFLIVPRDDKFLVLDGTTVVDELENNCRAQHISSDGTSHFCFSDDDANIVIVDITTGYHTIIANSAGNKPFFSANGNKIAIEGADGVLILDVHNRVEKFYENASNICPDAIGDGFFVKISHSCVPDVQFSEVAFIDDDGVLHMLTNTANFHENHFHICADGINAAFSTLPHGDVYKCAFNRTEKKLENRTLVIEGTKCPQVCTNTAATAAKMDIWVPYMHQKWDTPDWFPGGWSCGPSSCLMAVQKYSILPVHTITCSSPTVHTHDFGWYVPTEYTFNGYTYDILGVAPSETWVPGAHGFICREYGGAVWAYMVTFLQQHLLSSWQAGTAYSTFTAEIDAGYPVVASTSTLGYGHIQCFRGHFYNHAIIANDPYGNANISGWGTRRDGECVYYDWPGYDNGYSELGVSQLIVARHSFSYATPDTIVDDFSTGFTLSGPSQYWRAWIGGYNAHAFYTTTVASGTDENYCTWRPNLPCTGDYEVFTYIPNSNATATAANYQIHHTGGTSSIVVNQSLYSNAWVSLGTYNCDGASYVYIGDVTGTAGQKLATDAMRFGFRGTPIDTIIDDGDATFYKYGSATFWHEGIGGYLNHYWWTYSTNSADTCDCEWKPLLPYAGDWEVLVYVPASDAVAVARYRVDHSGGSTTVTVDQSAHSDAWVSLGTFYFARTVTEKVYLGDATGTSGRRIAFDAVRWHFVSLATTDTQNLPVLTSISSAPNPFNSSCAITITSTSPSTLFIHDILGREVFSQEVPSGVSQVYWQTQNLPTGVYFARLSNSPNKHRLLLLK